MRQQQGEGDFNTFYDLVSEVTNCHFCYILLVGSQSLASPDSRGEELGSAYREAHERVCGHILMPPQCSCLQNGDNNSNFIALYEE